MSRTEKLLQKLLSKPKDFTYSELVRFLKGLGYSEQQGSGSRVVFINDKLKHNLKLHKPHSENILKRYQIDLVIDELKTKDLL
jgi:hypothetical protein